MKTIPQLNKEINEITEVLIAERNRRSDDKTMKKSEVSKLNKKLVFLRFCIKYLETNPDHLFIRKEIGRVENMITSRMVLFVLDDAENKPKSLVNKLKKQHENKYEIPKFREQVRTMRFLLKV